MLFVQNWTENHRRAVCYCDRSRKKTQSTESESRVTKKPAVIKELEKYFEKPEIAVQCLVELSEGNDPEGVFCNLIPFRGR